MEVKNFLMATSRNWRTSDLETIEYFFDSKTQLIAEAQLINYFEMVEPHHRVLSRAESAIERADEASFWDAIEENMELAWTSGQVGHKWGIIKMLLDIWADPFSQGHFCELLDIQFERWIEVIEEAKRPGWQKLTWTLERCSECCGRLRLVK